MSAFLLQHLKDHQAKFIDLRFTEIDGKEQHLTLSVSALTDAFNTSPPGEVTLFNRMFLLDETTLLLDPFYQESTLAIRCSLADSQTLKPSAHDPRALATRAERYLKTTGIADHAFFSTVSEFFLFDDVRWHNAPHQVGYAIDAEEAPWNTGKTFHGGNIGHRASMSGPQASTPPIDTTQEFRSAICLTLDSFGIKVKAHRPGTVITPLALITGFHTLVQQADAQQWLKYVVHQTAHHYGKTATFMPKPLLIGKGSGIYCQQFLCKDNQNIFIDPARAGLSETALFYIGGLLKHARALNALTNPAINSYTRLKIDSDAPVFLTYAMNHPATAVHISRPTHAQQWVELRFPDATANPYLSFAAQLMAGLDGIIHRLHPGELCDAPSAPLPTTCDDLAQALQALQTDHDFLLQGGVFTRDFIQHYRALKQQALQRLRETIHPMEFELYYSL